MSDWSILFAGEEPIADAPASPPPPELLSSPEPAPISEEYASESPPISDEWKKNFAVMDGVTKPETPEAQEGVRQNMMLGVAETLGFISDFAMAQKDLNPMLGSVNPREGFAKLMSGDTARAVQNVANEYGDIMPPVGKEGTGWKARSSRYVGNSLVPFGATAKYGSTLKQAGVETGKTFLEKSALSFAHHPLKSTALEATSSVTAAGAGVYARDSFGVTSPWGMAAVELSAGAAPQILMIIPSLTKLAYQWGRNHILPAFSTKGSERVASNRVQALPEDLDLARARARGVDTESGVDVTVAQRTRSPELMALERTILEDNPHLRGEWKWKNTEANKQLKELITGSGDDTIEDAMDFLDSRREYLKHLIDRRVAKAEITLTSRLDDIDSKNLSPKQRKSEASKAVQETLQDLYNDGKAQSTENWNKTSKTATGSATTTRKRWATEIKNYDPKVDKRKDMLPDDLVELFGGIDKNGDVVKGSFPANATAKQIHKARSRVGAAIGKEAKARKPNQNRLRVLGNANDDLLVDLIAADDGSDSFKLAIDFSRDLYQKFDEGQIGKILRKESSTRTRVAGEVAFDSLLESSNKGVSRDLDQLLSAHPDSKRELTEWVYGSFFESVPDIETGVIKQKTLLQFLSKHEEILKRLPDVRSRIDSVSKANKFLAKMNEGKKHVANLDNAQKSKLGLFLDSPTKEIDTIFKDSTKKPVALAREIKRQAAKDPSGHAQAGLKRGFGEYIVEKSLSDKVDSNGHKFISGRKLKDFVDDKRNASIIQEMYTPEEIGRLRVIANTAEGVEMSLGALPDVGGISNDLPSKGLDFITRLFSLHSASIISKKMNLGAGQLSLAGYMSKTQGELQKKLIQTKPQKLLTEAVLNKELYMTLMMDTSSPLKLQKFYARMNSWLAGPGQHLIESTNKEEEQ